MRTIKHGCVCVCVCVCVGLRGNDSAMFFSMFARDAVIMIATICCRLWLERLILMFGFPKIWRCHMKKEKKTGEL